MKNLLSIAAVIVSGIFFANTASAQDANVRVNLHFKDFTTIKVNDGAINSTVDLYFQTLEDYKDGVETVKENQLSVASTKGYEIKVRSTSVNFSGSGAAIQLQDVSVALARNNSSNFSDAKKLSQTATSVYETTENTVQGTGAQHTFDVKYMAKGGELINNGALKQEYLGKTLSADIVYSIMPK